MTGQPDHQDLEESSSRGLAKVRRQNYEKPAIEYSDRVEGRAIRCSRGSDQDCPGGPITS